MPLPTSATCFARALRLSVAILPLLLPQIAPRHAHAAEPDTAAAETAFREGQRMLREGQTAAACALFETSQRLEAAVGTLLNLGDCYERLGRVASAWRTFRAAASAAEQSQVADARAEALRRANLLEPKVPKLRLEVPPNAPKGLFVKRDDELVEAAQLLTAWPVDPGTHTLVCSAPGYESQTVRVEVRADGRTSTVAIPPLRLHEGSAPAAASASTTGTTAAGAASSSNLATHHAPRADKDDSGTLKTAGWLTLGAGGVGLAVGGVLLAIAAGQWDSVTSQCDGDTCSAPAAHTRHDARVLADVGTIPLAIGLAATVAGASLLLFAPKGKPIATATLGPGSVSFVVRF